MLPILRCSVKKLTKMLPFRETCSVKILTINLLTLRSFRKIYPVIFYHYQLLTSTFSQKILTISKQYIFPKTEFSDNSTPPVIFRNCANCLTIQPLGVETNIHEIKNSIHKIPNKKDLSVISLSCSFSLNLHIHYTNSMFPHQISTYRSQPLSRIRPLNTFFQFIHRYRL